MEIKLIYMPICSKANNIRLTDSYELAGDFIWR